MDIKGENIKVIETNEITNYFLVYLSLVGIQRSNPLDLYSISNFYTIIRKNKVLIDSSIDRRLLKSSE